MPIALSVTTVTLGINYALMSLSSFRLPGVPLETWLYQATLPGLVEETVFRGVLLALADRAVAARHAWPPTESLRSGRPCLGQRCRARTRGPAQTCWERYPPG